MAITIDQFMRALFGQESEGSDNPYGAENGRTGAYGKYQILPSNWPSWSREAGIPGARFDDPQAQEKVARFKIQQYYNTYGNWEDVASTWYSGGPTASRNLDRPQGDPPGSEPTIRQYINSVMERAGGAMNEQVGPTIDDFIKTWPMPKPGDFKDIPAVKGDLTARPPIAAKAGVTASEQFQEAYGTWLDAYNSFTASTARNNSGSDGADSTDPYTDPNTIATRDYQNKVSQFTNGMAFDQLNLSKAAQDLDRWLSIREQSNARSNTVLQGQEMIRKYGTAPGKTSFSLSELGSGFSQYGDLLGVDPAKPFINYTGTMTVDPEGDMARWDNAAGAVGQAPATGTLHSTFAGVPAAPKLMMNPAYGGGVSQGGAGAGTGATVPLPVQAGAVRPYDYTDLPSGTF